MRFGHIHKIIFFVTISLLSCQCKQTAVPINFVSPLQGDQVNVGDQVNIKTTANNDEITSITYLVDGKILVKKNNADQVAFSTTDLPLGYRMISAIVEHGGKTDTINTNIVLKTNRKPVQLTYKIVQSFPHDTSAYTEGLSFVGGQLLESTGENGQSKLKYVDLLSGKTIKQTQLDPKYFGEGSIKIGNKIIMLTWKENIGFVFDANTLNQIGSFPYEQSREGWGLTFDGQYILRSDGSNRIWRMNATTYKEEGFIEVYDDKGPVESLNELEYIDGKIFANVYLTNKIVRINPKSGLVEATVDLSALVPKNFFKTSDEIDNNVLNGIAWDAQQKRLFVGGKKWPKLYEIKLIP